MDYGNLWIIISGALLLVILGGGLGYFIKSLINNHNESQMAEETEQRILHRLSEEDRAQRLDFLEEKDQWYKYKADQEKDFESQVEAVNQREKGLGRKDREITKKREELQKQWGQLKQREKQLSFRDEESRRSEQDLKGTMEKFRQQLEMVANMTADQAREQLLEHLAGEVRARSAAMIRAERIRAKEESEREAKKIIALAIQRCAVEEAVRVSTSTVTLPNEGIKSRIIGKEGRNVRAFETATGVKVVVDDTPDTVLLSSFDPGKREAAARAMKRLIADGGFTPSRIEDVVGKCKTELEEDMFRQGNRALADIGVSDHHPELPHYVGMMKYRTTVGQNLLQHSMEVAQLAGLIAAEIGLDVRLARRAGLLHDIGKTVSREMEGTHMNLGVELGEKFGEHPIVKEVIAEHHGDDERMSPTFFVVKAADTISSIRPGGRHEDLEGYARRIMRLEEIANSFDGVRDVYAINAGREIRVMVKGDEISDDDSELLSFDIAERVKNELTFAGEVKVMVVREIRSVRHTGKERNRRGGNRNSAGRKPRSGRRSKNTISKN